MPETGGYLFSNVGFNREEQPYLFLQKNESFETLLPLGKTLTLTFDTTQRYCIGWGDITTGERFVCPDKNQLDSKYEQCSACQKRTGFNPAFYHASSVSQQQEARNLQPHILYLAYFSPDTIKVGISHAARGNSRLLEQGARSAIILETFPSAHIARQYEAKIAALPHFAETVLLRKKVLALRQPYNQAEAEKALRAKMAVIEQTLHITFPDSRVLHLDAFFFPDAIPNLKEAVDCTDKKQISGKVLGMLGTLLFCEQQDAILFFPLKKYIGYPVIISYDEVLIALPARQASLF